MTFSLFSRRGSARQDLDAFSRSQAMIWFKSDGTIIDANENFCKTLGYTVEEISGRHHTMFVDADHAKSGDYGKF